MKKICFPSFIKKISLGENKGEFSLRLCGSEFHSSNEKLKSNDSKQSEC